MVFVPTTVIISAAVVIAIIVGAALIDITSALIVAAVIITVLVIVGVSKIRIGKPVVSAKRGIDMRGCHTRSANHGLASGVFHTG